MSKVFGIGLASVAKTVYELCEAIFHKAQQFIKFPEDGCKTVLEIEKFSYVAQTTTAFKWLTL